MNLVPRAPKLVELQEDDSIVGGDKPWLVHGETLGVLETDRAAQTYR